MKRNIFAGGAAAFFAALLVAGTASAADPIRIGNSSPLTGGLAYEAEQEQRSIKLAVEEINANGGVLGRPLEFVTVDNKCNPSEAAAAMARLLDQKVSVVLGCHCSSATLASMPLVQAAHIPLVSPIATSPKITDAMGVGGNNWTFRLNPSDKMLAEAIGSYLSKLEGVHSVAVVAEDSDYGRGGAEAFRKVAEAHGIKVVSTDFYPFELPDFTPILTRINASKVDAIALYTETGDQVNFMRQYQQLGMTAKFTGRVELAGANFDEMIKGGVMNGASSVFPYAPELDTAQNQAFVKKFVERYGDEPIYAAGATYEAVYVLADAIKRAGSDDPAAIQAALKSMKYQSMLGAEITFDDHNQAHNSAIILTVQDGVVKVAGVQGT